MNNKYIIKVEHPLLRPGLTIETEASENYLIKVVNKIMKNIRAINDLENGTTLTGTGMVVEKDEDGHPMSSEGNYIITTDQGCNRYETSEDGTYEIFPDGTRRLVNPDMFKGNPDGAVE